MVLRALGAATREQVDFALSLAATRPHDFTLQYPIRREFFKEHFKSKMDVARLLPTLKESVLLYLHVPFCQSKCYYCNFAVDTRKTPELHERYVDALIKQVDTFTSLTPVEVDITGIDIGGGTPTLLAPRLLEKVLISLKPVLKRSSAARPLSIETTPAIAAESPEKLRIMRENGVQRVSVGLQSTNDETLKSVNRSAQASLAVRALSNLRKTNFDRLSVDLIFALPGQTMEHWRNDLKVVVDLGVDTVTTYDCLYRGKGRVMSRRMPQFPGHDVYGAMYDEAYAFLTSHGFHAPYGSVNFSRHPGETGTSAYFEARLLDGMPYIGLGNYASSLHGRNWWFAPYTVDEWLQKVEAEDMFPTGDVYDLPPIEVMAKHALLSLSFGVLDPVRFAAAHGVTLEAAFGPSLSYAMEQGWLELRSASPLHMPALTPKQRAAADAVLVGQTSQSPRAVPTGVSQTDGSRAADASRPEAHFVYEIPHGMFRHMPALRSLFYSPDALRWFGDRLRDAEVTIGGVSRRNKPSTS